MPNTMKKTYRLTWEIIQEFQLPPNHFCCSVDVNVAHGEIMFACRHEGLLHYKCNPHTGLVLATEQPYRVTNYARNCRLVACCVDGSYLVLNHRQLRYMRLSSHRVQHTNPMVQMDAASTNRTGSMSAPESMTAYSRKVGMDHVEYLEQAVSVGDVRSMAADKQTDSVFLLYADRLVRNCLSNLADGCVFDRGYSLTTELFNVCMSRQFVYLMNSVGDLMVRYRSECYDRRDQLYWRSFGSRAFQSPLVVEAQIDINRMLCKKGHYLQLLDTECPVGVLGLTVDHCRQMAFASTGSSSLYVAWHPDHEPDLSLAGWGQNWLEDARIPLAGDRRGLVYRGSDPIVSDCAVGGGGGGTAAQETMPGVRNDSALLSSAFVPGPLASISSTVSRSGFLYAVDAITGDKVSVIRYSTETARPG